MDDRDGRDQGGRDAKRPRLGEEIAAEREAQRAAERREAERREAERRAAEEAQREAVEELQRETERREAEREAAEEAQREAERIEAERAVRAREAEESQRKAEEERLAAEKAEEERLAAEAASAEEERLAAEKAEEERLASEVAAAEKAEEERLAVEKAIAAEKEAEEEKRETTMEENKQDEPEPEGQLDDMAISKDPPEVIKGQLEDQSNGPGVESNPVRKSSRVRKKVEHYVGLISEKSKPIRKKTRGNTRKGKEKKTEGQGGDIKVVVNAKSAIKDVVKKLGPWTGTKKKYILAAINNLPDKNFHSINITATMKNNFFRVNKEFLFGLKKKGIGLVRKMIERDDAGAKQGPSLYGCGSGKKLQIVNSWIWCVNSDSVGQRGGAAAAAPPNDFLVRCWGTKVPCGFKLGGKPYENAGDGLNHEMEHGIACVKQAFGNLLAQQLSLKDDEKNRFRKYHSILLQIFTDHGIGGENPKSMVYYIMLMLRRQQIVNGLPSMSLFNQVKCDADLLYFDFKDSDSDSEFFSFTMKYSTDIIKAVVKLMDGESGTLGPCNMIGIKNKDSVYNKKNKTSKLEAYYRHSYSVYEGEEDFEDMIVKAVSEASTWAKSGSINQEEILTEQCELISSTYNSMFPDGPVGELLSGICLASSILVMTVVMKSTYVELETENPIVPELNIWADKALVFLKGNCGKIMDHTDHIEKQVNEMRKSCKYNQASLDYLEMKDTTIRDLVSDAVVVDLVNRIRVAIPLAGGADAADGADGADADTAATALPATQPFEDEPFEDESTEDESTTESQVRTPETREAGVKGTGMSGNTTFRAVDTPEVRNPSNSGIRQDTVVRDTRDPREEVLIDGESKMESGTPKVREKEIEYMEPDYYTSFSEYTEMIEPNVEKWTKFLDLLTLRMNESDLLQILNLFEGYCPDEEDLEICGSEENCMGILEGEVEELNESFICYLSCMSNDFYMILPERMFNEFQEEGIGDLSKEDKARKKKTKKKHKSRKNKKSIKKKTQRKSKRKKKRKTTKKKKKGDLIDKIIDRLGY